MLLCVERIGMIDYSTAVQSHLNAFKWHDNKAAGFAAASLQDCSFLIRSMIFLKVCVNASDRMFVLMQR